MHKLQGINIVIASGSEQIQQCLQEAFQRYGAIVCLCDYLNLDFVKRLEAISDKAEVILIDMDDSYEDSDEALDRLLERIDLPILFHDNDFDDIQDPQQECGFSEPAINKLAIKLAELARSNQLETTQETEDEQTLERSDSYDGSETIKQKAHKELEFPVDELSQITQELLAQNEELAAEIAQEKQQSLENEPTLELDDTEQLQAAQISNAADGDRADNVWVLGASIGGPEAVKRFLARIPVELPVAFVLAQHLGEGFVSLLATQLDRISCFKVKEAQAGDVLKHGEVIVVPIEQRMILDEQGQVKFLDEKWKGHYKPSIDSVIKDVCTSYKERAGVIIFSGMGADGVLASQKFAEQYQGNIWAQNSDTCVVSSMPDSVRKANLVSYSGSPEALALKIAMHYMGKDAYIN